MKEFHCTWVDTVTSIKKEDRDAFFGGCPEGSWFYETLEQSALEGFSFQYLLVHAQGRLVALLPLFTSDFHADTVLEEPVRRIAGSIRAVVPRFLIFKTLFCGSPFGEQGLLGLAPDVRDNPALLKALVRELTEFSRRQDLSLIIFKDYAEPEALVLDRLDAQGFFKTGSFPSAIIDLPFKSFDEYLASLSHAHRKDLRRKLKKAREQGALEIRVVGRVDDIIDDIYRLYLNTYNAGSTKFEKLTPDFFMNTAARAGTACKFFLYYIRGRLAAFNLCFVHEDLLIDKFIGFDYDLARQYGLYFVSWCENIRWCLENGMARYQVGQTDYEPKTRLGCRLVPLYAYVRHTNSLVNRSLRILAKFLNF